MRFTFVILLFCGLGADAQMIIKAHPNYVPLSQFSGLLDNYSGAAAAYSLRKLDKDYTGSAVRVRRSNDNTEQDIGFTSSGDLDTASLKTFVGANSGFVTTWYNQADSAGIFGVRNATNTTASQQPRIMQSGVIEMENSRPSINFISASNNRLQTIRILSDDNFNCYAAVRMNGNNANNTILSQHSGAADIGRSVFLVSGDPIGTNPSKASLAFNNGTTYQIHTTTNYSTISLSLFESDSDGNGNSNIYLNGSGTGTLTGQTWTPLNTRTTIGALGNGINPLSGKISELVIYSTKQSLTSGIRANINSYYGIY
jgi:hypothetical protein